MKTLKARTLEEIREKVFKTEWYRQCLQSKEEIFKKIENIKNEGGYVERDLYEELYSINRALNINYASKEIIKGYMSNKPFLRSMGGHSRMSVIRLYYDKERRAYNKSFFIFDAKIYPAWKMPD